MRGDSMANGKRFLTTKGLVISVLMGLLMAQTLSTAVRAEGPALTTIGGTVYRADGTSAAVWR